MSKAALKAGLMRQLEQHRKDAAEATERDLTTQALASPGRVVMRKTGEDRTLAYCTSTEAMVGMCAYLGLRPENITRRSDGIYIVVIKGNLQTAAWNWLRRNWA